MLSRDRHSSGLKANMAPRIAPPSLWRGRKPPGGKWPDSTRTDDAEGGSESESSSNHRVIIRGTGPRKAPPNADNSGKPPGSTLTNERSRPSQKS